MNPPFYRQSFPRSAWRVLIHGGAGAVEAASLEARQDGARRAARAGGAVLEGGGSALDAVLAAVEILEDDPLFNAGTGACLTTEGRVELDASIMDGPTLRCGAVCALPPFRHPIAIARAVLEEGHHVLYASGGARAFALARGFEALADDALVTEEVRAQFERARATNPTGWGGGLSPGTVGAVARDARGSLAAATSTGGRMLKRPGRVGDTPIPGAGNYADENAAVSATGDGEAFIRTVFARVVAVSLREGGPPSEALLHWLRHLTERTQGTGGAIAVNADGEAGLARNTSSMVWGCAGPDGTSTGI